MPIGNEGSHVIDGLTVKGGLGIGVNGPYLAENDVINHHGQVAPRYNYLETFPRTGIGGTVTLVDQRLHVLFWTAPVTKTVTTMSFTTAGTGTTSATLVRYGIYTLSDPNATGAALTITLAASTPNDTALLLSTVTEYPKALSTPYTVNAGQRYGLAVLTVSSGAPALACVTTTVNTGLIATTKVPQVGTHFSSQADLPASGTCANASIAPAYIALS